MDKFFKIIVVFSGLLAAVPVNAKVAGVTADGTWDCIDNSGTLVGSVVIVDTNYAFIKLDGRVGPYGNLFRTGQEQFDLPSFVILDGYLKETLLAIGMSMTGPRENEHDLSGEHFLKVIFTEDNIIYCTRRKLP